MLIITGNLPHYIIHGIPETRYVITTPGIISCWLYHLIAHKGIRCNHRIASGGSPLLIHHCKHCRE